jgi:hypothetical protein
MRIMANGVEGVCVCVGGGGGLAVRAGRSAQPGGWCCGVTAEVTLGGGGEGHQPCHWCLDPVSSVRTGVASTVACQTLARVSFALQRSNAMTLRTYLTDCVHHANTSVPVPPRFRRK